jgi:bacteriocin-like protein
MFRAKKDSIKIKKPDSMTGASKIGTEISDEELEKVSGGLWPRCSKTIDLSGGGYTDVDDAF